MRAPDRSSKVDALERWANDVDADDLVEADTARLCKPTDDPDGETQQLSPINRNSVTHQLRLP